MSDRLAAERVGRSTTVNSSMFTSVTDEWGTPWEFFDMLNDEFGFDLDVCASAENAKCSMYFDKDTNGLAQDWTGTCWMNPPYGRVIGDWVKKAYEESLKGATVVCLIPARTDTAYWHDYVMRADEIRLVRGRLHFDGTSDKGHNAPFPCAVVVYRPERSRIAYHSPTWCPRVSAIGRQAEEVA